MTAPSKPVERSEEEFAEFLAKKTVSRDEISDFLGVRRNYLTEMVFRKRIVIPMACGKTKFSYLYDAEQIVAWIKTKPFELTNRITGKPSTKIQKPPKIDNAMAIAFITAKSVTHPPLITTKLSKKHGQIKPKTTVVHLYERNDYIPPHSGLTLSSRRGAGYISHYAGNGRE